MKKRGRSQDQALLRTVVNKKSQTYSQKRLIKDLQEIEKQKIPTVGVTARPLENDMFVWHANIKGPEKTPYQGGVFHLEIRFPLSYPHHPPTITIFNPIPHPNVFGQFICLDMITQNCKRIEGEGWSSVYSAQSILNQLQSYLFQENLTRPKEELDIAIKLAVKQANSFKCRSCKHGGKLSCWPQFSTHENQMKEFEIKESQKELIKKELICFHTKLSYQENQLGLGLRVSKIPRTGNIREAETFFDYISIKAFLKESVRFTSTNERLTHWLPVYFGKGDNEEKFLKFLTKSLSMIMTNSTRNFKKEFVLEVLPKLMLTIIYYVMDEKKHASIRNIRLLVHIHSIFLFSIKKIPELAQMIRGCIENFLSSEEKRTKNYQPNLGCILTLLSGIDSYKFSDVAQAYFGEQLDRQVLWILKSVPELLDESLEEDVDKERARAVFKSQKTSFHIFCFNHLFIKEVCEKRKSRQSLLDEYEENLCKLSNRQEEQLQKRIIEIQQKVTNFQQFFQYVGLQQRTEEQVTEMLKKAIKNSERKKYHGQFETLHQLPSSQEQFKKLLSKVRTYRQFFDIQKNEKGENGQAGTYQIKQRQSTDEDWRKMCIDKWYWIKEAFAHERHLTARQISQKAIQFAQKGILKSEDRVIKINQKYKSEGINYNVPKIDVPETSWKQLFLRLDLEDFLLYIDMNPDFTSFYEKLEICRFAGVNTLLVPLITIKQLKSGYFYLTSLLSRLNTIKHLQFSGLPQKNLICEKAARSIQKGLKNFIDQKGELDTLSFHNIVVEQNKDYSQNLFYYLLNSCSLKSLRFANANILLYGHAIKILSRRIAELRELEQLVFDQCSLDEEKCKSIADVLMRAKNLRIFKIHNSGNVQNGLTSLIYNISFFSPHLKLLDISRCSSNVTQTIVSLYKMIKITSSLQVLLIQGNRSFNEKLIEEFWVRLGQCPSLRVLDISQSGDIKVCAKNIGNAIAFNSKKKGSLEYLNLQGCICNTSTIYDMYRGMCISEYDEQRIYGEHAKAEKMIESNYPRQYFNGLKALQFNECSNLNPRNFNLSQFNKIHDIGDPKLVKLLAQSPSLLNVGLSQTGLGKSFAEMLSLAIDPRRAQFRAHIKVLNLSKNLLGKEGMKAIGQTLVHNQIIEVLDVSKNQIGTQGAIELGLALQENRSLRYLSIFNNKVSFDGAKLIADKIVRNHPKLQCLEIGHNRIRDKGLKQIVDAIVSNKQSSLQVLGLRFNYITNVGATYLCNKLTSSNTKVEEVFLANNLVDDAAINNLEQIRDHEKSRLYIDIFDKLKYIEQERLERTIWIHPIDRISLHRLKQFFEITQNCGIVLDIRVRRAPPYPIKNGQNLFGFVQFADAISVNRSLHVASQKLTCVDGVKFRVYKAGTGTFLYSKQTGKQKKLLEAKDNLIPTPYDRIERKPNIRRPPRITKPFRNQIKSSSPNRRQRRQPRPREQRRRQIRRQEDRRPSTRDIREDTRGERRREERQDRSQRRQEIRQETAFNRARGQGRGGRRQQRPTIPIPPPSVRMNPLIQQPFSAGFTLPGSNQLNMNPMFGSIPALGRGYPLPMGQSPPQFPMGQSPPQFPMGGLPPPMGQIPVMGQFPQFSAFPMGLPPMMPMMSPYLGQGMPSSMPLTRPATLPMGLPPPSGVEVAKKQMTEKEQLEDW